MNHKTGGPAFPSPNASQKEFDYDNSGRGNYPGMTLRDYFAAAALTGLCARMSDVPRMYALVAYIIADAMLAKREES